MGNSERNGALLIALSIAFAAVVIGGALIWVNRTPESKSKKEVTAPSASSKNPAPSKSATDDSTPKIIERSERARSLQRELKRLGFYSGAMDGIYGPATTDAVKRLQTKLGVEVTGIFNPATAAAGVAQGYFKKSETVMSMQVALTTLGYYDGEVNGLYDAATGKAITAFQKDQGIKSDGFFSPELGSALDTALNGE